MRRVRDHNIFERGTDNYLYEFHRLAALPGTIVAAYLATDLMSVLERRTRVRNLKQPRENRGANAQPRTERGQKATVA